MIWVKLVIIIFFSVLIDGPGVFGTLYMGIEVEGRKREVEKGEVPCSSGPLVCNCFISDNSTKLCHEDGSWNMKTDYSDCMCFATDRYHKTLYYWTLCHPGKRALLFPIFRMSLCLCVQNFGIIFFLQK